jgi:hypothetical protein
MRTVWPAWTNAATPIGVSATRRSLFFVSVGVPMITYDILLQQYGM